MKGIFTVCTYRKLCVTLSCMLFTFLFCIAQTNAIKDENALAGNPSSEWDIGEGTAGSTSLQGFATEMSVNRGERVNFKINASSNFTYTIKIYRLGYYQGNGARLITTLGTNYTGVVQPQPVSNTQTGIVDCGNWPISAYWDVPSTAVSGVYIAKLTSNSNSSITSHIYFIVRNDASHSDILYQTSDATWQAYNTYGGNSFYQGATPSYGRAVKISYNRPFITREGVTTWDFLFGGEYPLIRFLERNGYDVSYFTNVDAARRGNLIQNHKIFISGGHDEYWSAEQRTSVENARNAGVHLAFFSGNEIYWKTRWENSVDGNNTPYRTLVCYKEGTLGELSCGECDPTNIWTGLWRDGCSSSATGGCQPENKLSGQISWAQENTILRVPSTYKNLRFWRNTSVASLVSGDEAVFPTDILGGEVSYEQYPDSYPPGRFTMSSTTMTGNKVHKLSLYKYAASNAFVFGAGTFFWGWGLDNYHDYGNAAADSRIQQATVNLLADMGNVQPTSLQSGLVVASPSTDFTAPAAKFTYPSNGNFVQSNSIVDITGTTTDAGGVPAAVEVSLDGGTTWKAANGTTNWTFQWTPTTPGTYTLKVRGVDDSGNIETATTGNNTISVTVLGDIAFTASTPINLSTKVPTNTTIKATFNQNISLASVTATTFQLKDANNNLVPATRSISNNNQIVLTPSAALSQSTTYTVTIKGGASGIQSTGGGTLAGDSSWVFTTTDPTPIAMTDGPGGPILVISRNGSPFSRYAVEILRAEGLNEFAALDFSAVTSTVLDNYDVVILGEMTVSSTEASMLSTWVDAGGTLIAFRPSANLLPLLGLSAASGTLSDKYLLINTSSGPGVGIVNQTIQFHGTANLHPLNGATSIATLYSNATTATTFPAVTTRDVGANGGKAIAFTYDLAKSIVYTRQGNPAWAGTERDGVPIIRSDDQYYPDWVDFNKIAIPQADEQQRLLANIIIQSNLHKKPLPRFWYLPRSFKAAIVMTGDDHANGGTSGRFDKYLTLGPNSNQDFFDWKTVRGSSYVFTNISITNDQAVAYHAKGFEIALHPNDGCVDYTPALLQNTYSTQLSQFIAKFPSIPSPVSNRNHCLLWSDWATVPKTEVQNGMRLDVNYYYYPQAWMQNRPGMFTGSGIPMRFADLDGSLIDCYQVPTPMTDETNMDYATFCNALLDKAVGPEGYYGVFATNMHTDLADHYGSDEIIASAQQRGVPIVSGAQMLEWLDGKNNSSFNTIIWAGNQLSFTVIARSGARNLKGMLPLFSQSGGQITSIDRNGSSLTFTTQTIKGIQYAFFDAPSGNYVATYGAATSGTLNGTVVLEGRPAAPNAQWSIPVEVELYTSGNPNPVATFNATTYTSGQFSIIGVPTGTYNIKVKSTHTLAKVATAKNIVVGDNNVNFGTLSEGDADNNNAVNLFDFAILLNTYNKTSADSGYDSRADFNNDNSINLFDFALLLSNYNHTGETP